jgi:hypothetical protein
MHLFFPFFLKAAKSIFAGCSEGFLKDKKKAAARQMPGRKHERLQARGINWCA